MYAGNDVGREKFKCEKSTPEVEVAGIVWTRLKEHKITSSDLLNCTLVLLQRYYCK